MKKNSIFSIVLLLAMGINGQEIGTSYTPVISQAAYHDVSQPLNEVAIEPLGAEFHHQWKYKVVENKFKDKNIKKTSGTLPIGEDLMWQKEFGGKELKAPIQNFEGTRNSDNGGGGVAPPDTDGDVGPNHYFQMCNLIFQIFDKSGNTLLGPLDNSTIWSGFIGPWTGSNDGDPIVLYDGQADRWLVSQFAINTTNGTYWELVAISTTPDPTGSYYRYAFQFTSFPDYPKFGIWRDGYYVMVQHGTSTGAVTAAAFERDQMLIGGTADMVSFAMPSLPGGGFIGMLPSDNDGDWAPVGTPNYFMYFSDDAWGDDPVDRLKIWEFDVNWTTPASSTLVLTQNLNTNPFDSYFSTFNAGNVGQPGTTMGLATLEGALMNRLQYRNFGTYETMVLCHTVDINNTPTAGIRWYELRKPTGGSWSIYQQGTYSPGTDHHWMASIAMNGDGGIALGYSVSSETTYPSIRYTGRAASDPLGTMTYTEQSIKAGTNYQTGATRWGDYSMMSVDPVDDVTFWYTNEYLGGNGWSDWVTQIASFQITPPSLTAAFTASPTEVCSGGTITFTDQSYGSPISWSWSFPGGTPSSFSGANPPAITYNTPGTYNVSLTVGDGTTTDTETKTGYITVANIFANFTGTPTTVVVGNSVTFTDNSFCNPTSWNWSFTGGTPATATGAGPHTITYSTLGTYNASLTVSNALGNDTETKTAYINVVPLSYCIPTYTSGTGFGDYISLVQLGSINNATGASASPYYTYYSALSTNLTTNTAYTITLSPGTYSSGNNISVWIDYNKNGVFETTEKLGNVTIPPTPATGTINFTVPANAISGTTRMRVREVWENTNFDPCASYGYGETEDYNVNIQSTDLLVDLTAFLEGPYNGSIMTQGLAGLVPLNQPYNISPWNYTGTESVGAIPANAIDWVLIELRNATTAGGATSGTRIGRKAAFIRNDGRVISLTGTPVINFGPLTVTNSLFVIVHHRNHVSVLSATGLTQTVGIYTYSFTTGSAQAYGGTLAHKLIGSGVWGLFGGNSDGNGVVDSNDEDPIWENQAGTKGYLKSDFNFDTQSNNKDKDNIWKPNLGKGNQVPN